MPTPDRTSLAEIVAAGREILEIGGPAGLTMQAVAVQVGVRAPSLYKRVKDRDALLAAVAQAVIDDLAEELEAAGDDLRRIAEIYRSRAHAKPEGFRLMFTAVAPHDAVSRAAAPVTRAAAALVGDADALDAARLFTAWATGFLQMELSGAFRMGGDVDRAFDFGLSHLVDALTPPQGETRGEDGTV